MKYYILKSTSETFAMDVYPAGGNVSYTFEGESDSMPNRIEEGGMLLGYHGLPRETFNSLYTIRKVSNNTLTLRKEFDINEGVSIHAIQGKLVQNLNSDSSGIFEIEYEDYQKICNLIFKKAHDDYLRLDIDDKKNMNRYPLQQIYYGAPGTGKSFEIDKIIKEGNLSTIRTTFHPDSDYSTFVGAYKPFVDLAEVRVVPVVMNNGISLNQNEGTFKEKRIIYKFVMQAFMKAYLAAWKKMSENPDSPKAQILVVEEINRGNCAQIFGDLFQLLDRQDNGFSAYPIGADSDLQQAISEAFKEQKDYKLTSDINVDYAIKDYISNYGKTLSKDIQEGRILLLPKNLHIWATMNTSDQSLFPIDSAFKRRWDWKYITIADAKKNYVIEIDNDQYDWWSFLEAINAIIESTTHSEDKKLGYFFAKAKDGKITADTFVGKVIFYLWNDVFKDNETNHKAFKDSDGELLPFRKFFHCDGTVDTNMVIKFLQDLEVYPFETPDDGTATISDTTPNAKRQRDKSRYRVNGTDNLNKAQMTREAFRLYIKAHPDADAQTIAQAWNGLGLKDYVRHLVEIEAEFNARTKDSTDNNKRATEFELSNGEKIYLSTQFGIGNIGKFIDAVNNAGWNIRIENQA